jgi:hypothetical protein
MFKFIATLSVCAFAPVAVAAANATVPGSGYAVAGVAVAAAMAVAYRKVKAALARRVIYRTPSRTELTRKLRVVFVVQTPAMRDPKTLFRDLDTGATLAYWGTSPMPEVGAEFVGRFKVKACERFRGRKQLMIYAPKVVS